MAYTPPYCGAVDFVLRTIVIPSCSSVNFDISTDTTGITSFPSTIYIYNNTWYFVEGTFITSDPSTIFIKSSSMPFETLTEIAPEDSTVHIFSDTDLLRVLPDCISDPSTIFIHNSTMNVLAGRENDLPSKLSTGGISCNWELINNLDEFTELDWENANKADKFDEISNGDFELVNNEASDSWMVIPNKDKFTNSTWDKFTLPDHLVQSLWNTLLITDKHREIVYGGKTDSSALIIIPYRQPGPKDSTKTCFYDTLEDASIHFSIPWLSPEAKDKHHLVPWGPLSYFPFCSTKYIPITDGIVNFKLEPQDPAMIGVCYKVTFDVHGLNTDPRCPYHHHHTGRRDPYIDGILITHIYPPPLKETYRMMNTVLVKRIPDNAPIEVTSINIKYDKQSWLWAFSLTIGKDKSNYLDLIKPDPGNLNIFTDIEIYINGWKWVCRVESWNESRSFPRDSWTVTGRSPSMELGSPMNQKTSYVYDPEGTSLTSGVSIMEQVLDGSLPGINMDDTNWELDFTAYGENVISGFVPSSAGDWGIPPNTFSWSNLTQIEVIKQLTDAIGAFIMTEPNCHSANKKLYVKPLVNVPPWYWNATSPHRPDVDHVIRTSYVSEIGRNYESLPVYTSVYVIGQNSVEAQKSSVSSGIPIVEVYKTFGGPDRIYASDYTNPWITTWQSAIEQGRNILSNTGEWINHSLRLFSIEEKTRVAPLITGLVLPGEYVQVEEKIRGVLTNWYGTVSSTEINANIVNRAAFAVTQTIEVNEYIGG